MLSTVTEPEARSDQRLTYLVKRVEMALRARLEEALQPLGVTLPQYTALSLLEHREGLSSAQLARRHFVTPQAMNQLVATLERDGLIERRADTANRKILRAWLTDRGADVLASCHRLVDELEERMLAALTSAETATLRRALERSLTALATR